MRVSRIYTVFLLIIVLVNQIKASDKPNILFIIGDDMGADIVNGFSSAEGLPNTPNLDKLRSTGIAFTNAWAAPVCSATRASILTGQYGINNGVPSVPGVLKPTYKSVFKEIQELTNNAYKIGVSGKWHIGNANKLDHPILHGADDFMGVISAGVEDYNEWSKVEDGVKTTSTEYASSYFTDYATTWIKEQTQPWFMWLAHVAPHTPFHAPPSHMYSGGETNSNEGKFHAMIESLDYEVGRLLDSIPQDVLDNTLIIFIGDNGSPGSMLKGHPEGHGKTTVYQGGVHVPLIISGKGVNRVNEQEDAMVNIADFYATLSQVASPSAFPSGLANDGYSFKHLFTENGESNRPYNYMGLGKNSNVENDLFTITDGKFKLIQEYGSEQEMYNIEVDPFEGNDLLLGELSAEEKEAKSTLELKLAEIKGVDLCNDNILNGNETEIDCGGDCEACEEGNNGAVSGGSYPIVHTGVSDFYDETSIISQPDMTNALYWQDAGRLLNEPSYSDNGDGTITDNVTGLMWEQNMGEKITYTDAFTKADTLTKAGYSDWRVPTIKELYSLILFSGRVFGSNAMTMFIDTEYFDQPLGDTNAGEREIDGQTWSATKYDGFTMNADETVFGVNFVDGRIKGYPTFKKREQTDNKMFFRMVRGNMDYGKNNFSDNGNETITDSATMLMWQKADDGTARTWLQSIEYCEDLTLGGYGDWHLPNAKELQSLVDYDRGPQSTNSAAIDPLFSTSTINDANGNPGHYPYFWSTSPHLDGPKPYTTAVYVAFGEASGELNGQLLDVHGAGSQRSDPKTGNANDYPAVYGPQGDIQMVFNHCRCVRNIGIETSIQNVNTSNAIAIYPNPVKNILTIDVSTWAANTNYEIYSVSNKLMITGQLTRDKSEVNMSNLDSGLYLLKVFSDNGEQTTVKFIKSN